MKKFRAIIILTIAISFYTTFCNVLNAEESPTNLEQYENQFRVSMDKYKMNFSQISDAQNSIASSISYTQEEKEKRFIGKLTFKLKKSSNNLINVNITTSEISNGIGPVGIFNLFGNDQSSLSKGAKISVGITLTNSIKKETVFVTIMNAIKGDQVAKGKAKKYLENKKKPDKYSRIQGIINSNNKENFSISSIDEFEELKKDLTSKIHNFSFSIGPSYSDLEYLSPEKNFEKLKDHFWGYSLKIAYGYSPKASNMIGATFELEKSSKVPQQKNLIQEFQIQGTETIPLSWESKQCYLEPLKRIKSASILLEYRLIFQNTLSFNPILKASIENSKLAKFGLATNILTSFDQERKWNIGIQPTFYFIKNEKKIFKPNLGIAIYLTTAFKLFD